ncbi:MAG TPA: immunoglobulin domain-containing protein [Verrucomicrobiae bacterium]|nr:immunoglobulin domain-containing protein [Verrucomicrobiae bacterium]
MKNPKADSSNNPAQLAMNGARIFPATFLLCCLALLFSFQTVHAASYLTTTNIQGAGTSWTAAIWKTNTAVSRPGISANQTGAAVAAAAGNDYEIISNGVAITSGTVSPTVSLVRTPTTANNTFPGLSLTVDTNTVLMYKAANGSVDIYTNLILKGGVVCKGNGGAASTATITGAVQVVSQSYISAATDGNRVNGIDGSVETFNFSAVLSGSGNLFFLGFPTNSPNIISGGANNLGYHGTFVIQAATLLGTNAGSLGTNTSVILDPLSTLYKADMPGVTITNLAAKALFDVGYAYNTSGTLIITNGGQMNLHQHCAFSSVIINGTALSAGDHLYSELAANFPNNFLPGGSDTTGSLTVQSYNPNWVFGSPVITKQPESLSLYSGGMVHFAGTANFTTAYQWLSNSVPLTGATNTTLVYGPGSANLVAGVNYQVVASSINGSVTSSVATVSIRTPTEPYETAVANLGPYAFYQLNETANPATTIGGATVFDNANSLNGIYGIDAQNGGNSVVGPTSSVGFPGFDNANTAFNSLNNDANSTVALPSLNLNTNTVTMMAWIYPTIHEGANVALVFCRGGNSGVVAGLNYSPNFNGSDYSLGYTWNSDQNTYNWDSQLYVPLNQWSLVALTVTPTNATVYLLNANGIASSRHDYPHIVQSFNGTTLIGGDSVAANRTFLGTIDDVAVFNKALTRDQLSGVFYAASGVTNYPPIIVTQPASKSVYAGQPATFTVVGGGSEPLTYQWQADTGTGFTNIINGGQFSGANSATLTISGTTSGNAGNYQLVLSNTWDNITSSAASLTVNATSPAMNITLSVQQAVGANWETPVNWNDGQGGLPASVSAAQFPGSTYELLAGSRLRTPATNSMSTFPGNQLTVDGNGVWINNPGAGSLMGEIRLKTQVMPVNTTWTVNFTKLVMNGGQIDNGPDGTPVGYITIGGEVDILSNTPVYNDGTGGDNCGYNITALLTGNGTVEYHGDTTGSIPFSALTNNLNIANAANTFRGTWNVVSGILLGSAPGSLGTNAIVIGSTTQTNAALETTYDINNPNGNLILYGKMFLHQNDTFRSVFINGTPLAAGTYSFATLNSTYPANFPSSWAQQNGSPVGAGSGQIIVLVSPAPIIVTQPQSLTLYPGQSAATFSITAVGNTPLVFQWFTNGTVALSDNGNRIGSTSNVLTIPNPAMVDSGNYTIVVTNVFGAVTSSVATLTVLTSGPAMNFTLDFGGTPIAQPIGAYWDTITNWNPNGQPASVSKYSNPGSTYEVVVGARLRTPDTTNYGTFPGDQLTIDGSGVFENATLNNVGELRLKHNPLVGTNYFKKLVMNGGQINNSGVDAPNVDTSADIAVIQGELDILAPTPIYIESTAGNDRSIQIDSLLTGAGTIFWHSFGGALAGTDLRITGTSNTFTGQWIVDQGALVGMGAGSLGTNTIVVGTSGLTAAVETLYDINNASGGLVLGANGMMLLHQNDQFASVTVNGTSLANGTYSFATLNSTYPANFPASWTLQNGSAVATGSGQIVVGNSPPSSPHITNIGVSGTTLSVSAANGAAGGPWMLLQSSDLTLPLSQWLTNSSGVFDGGGNLSTNILNTATNTQEFYILKVQ